MKHLSSLVFSLILCFGLNAQTKKVLLIGIDGVRPDALVAANTPNMDVLMANGSYTFDAMNDGITISGPGWGSLLNGVWPDKHGVVDNTFIGYDILNYPHLFTRIEQFNPDLYTLSICQWSPINIFLASTAADVIVNVDDHTSHVEAEAISRLSTEDPDVTFLHFDDVDHAGHGSGFTPSNPNYTGANEPVDAAIGNILNAVYNRPDYANENWAIIVSTDHGGIGTSHGGNAFVERNIFMIVSGDSIPNQQIFADSSLVTIPPVSNCLGDSVQLYFDGSSRVTTEAYDFSTVDFTVECRVRTTVSGDYAIVTDKDWDSGYNKGWVFSFNAGGGPWKVNIGDGSNRVDVEGGIIDDGEWHTISATFDLDGMLTLYQDGVEVGSESISNIGDFYDTNPICMGQDINGGYGFTGHVAEVRVFSGLVAPGTIDTWKCSTVSTGHPDYSNLVAYWRMTDGASSSTIADLTAGNATGTITGATWESAIDTIYEWQFDYSNTPKQVDYVVSALEHMCIPIDPAWNLDGNVFATSCSQTVNLSDGAPQPDFVVRYLGQFNGIEVRSNITSNYKLTSSDGKLVMNTTINEGVPQLLNTTDLGAGVYFWSLESETGIISSDKVVIH